MLILYKTEDGKSQVQLRAKGQTVWLLDGKGNISHEQMEASTFTRYLDFDERGKKQEALAADESDDAELNAIEAKLSRRPRKQTNHSS